MLHAGSIIVEPNDDPRTVDRCGYRERRAGTIEADGLAFNDVVTVRDAV